MAKEQSKRTLEIQIFNRTQKFTLRDPRTFLVSGQSCVPPIPELLPGSTDSCHFSSLSESSSIMGVLVYEAESFTLVILFVLSESESRPLKLGLELSLAKSQLSNLEDSFHCILGTAEIPVPYVTTTSLREIHQNQQEPVQVSAGPVKVTATMSHCRNAVIRVVVGEHEEVGKETPGTGKHVQKK